MFGNQQIDGRSGRRVAGSRQGWATTQTGRDARHSLRRNTSIPAPNVFVGRPCPPSSKESHDRPARAARPGPWSTSSCGDEANTLPMELLDLGDHFYRCYLVRGPFPHLLALFDAAGRFLAPRVITTLVVLSVTALGVFAFL